MGLGRTVVDPPGMLGNSGAPTCLGYAGADGWHLLWSVSQRWFLFRGDTKLETAIPMFL